MTTETVINQIEKAIKDREKGAGTLYHFVIREGKILCMPTPQLEKDENLFCSFTEGTLEAGLTSPQWFNLGLVLQNELIRLKLECQPSKP